MDKLAIFNMAISLAGGGDILPSTSTQSPIANICNLWYGPSRDWVFKRAPWAAIEWQSALALISENDFEDAWTAADPPLPWRYAYSAPTGLLQAREIRPADAQNSLLNHDFEVTSKDGVKIVATNVEGAILTYTAPSSDPLLWDVDLAIAVANYLSHNIIFRLSGNPKLKQSLMNDALQHIAAAQVSQANQDQRTLEPDNVTILESRRGLEPIAHYPSSSQKTYPDGIS